MASKQSFALKKWKSWLTLESVYVRDAAIKNEGNIIPILAKCEYQKVMELNKTTAMAIV